MKGFWLLMSRIKNYRSSFVLSIVSNIFLSIFTVISIPLLIPFFQILFDRVQAVAIRPTEYKDINGWIKYYISDLINKYSQESVLLWVCLLLIVIFFLKNLFRYSALYFMAPLRYGIIYDLRSELYNKYLELPFSYYSDERKGVLLSSMTNDVQEVEWSVLNVIEAVFKSPIVMIGSIIFMIFISPALTLFVFILVVFAGLIIGKVVSSLKNASADVQRSIGLITAHVEETLGGLRIIKSFNAEKYQSKKFDEENTFFRKTLQAVVNRRDLAAPLSEFLGVTVVTILMWYGSNLVFKSELAPETFFAFIFAFYQVIEPAKSFSSAYFNIQKGLAAMNRINGILATNVEIREIEQPVSKTTFNENLTFENVSFKYKGADVKALDDLSLTIKKGSVVAFVGSSGAGKTTLVDLLPRFYDVGSGAIKIDGVDLRSLKLADLRSFYGIVSQEAILFHDTIANNIVFGAEGYTKEDIIAAAKIANAHDFISTMTNGYDTNIGDRGVKLSGGQRQRLTIARAVLRNPPILILDEATSALDAESERWVQDALNNLMKNRTSIVIAHRLSTIQNADVIIVLDNGKIIEQGSHTQLMNDSGAYRKFVEMQNFSK